MEFITPTHFRPRAAFVLAIAAASLSSLSLAAQSPSPIAVKQVLDLP